ncbi:MAG: hypothetical protein JWL96_3919 [Sphingomonas bacterium]|nr:hypothetical protein [Sphingomonas bacterium]
MSLAGAAMRPSPSRGGGSSRNSCAGAVPRSPGSFLQRVPVLAQTDHDAAHTAKGWAFFDRGVIDASPASII